ncbi:MAG: CBO0543 family protein [Burkholderiales bacterium]
MLRILFILLYGAVCFKWGAWKRWKEFYPTILYMITGNLAYSYIYCNYPLWHYKGLWCHTINDLAVAFLVYPCAVIVFLTHWPQGRFKQIAYILAWSAFHTLIEHISTLAGGFEHYSGWNIFWSAGMYICMFALIRVHYRRPLVAWLISAVCAVIIAVVFGLPLESLE